MTITTRVQSEFFEESQELIRIAPNQGRGRSTSPNATSMSPGSGPGQSWTNEEHDRFLEAMELFPSGPWKVIANYVGTKTSRQTMTHAQKYRQKIARRKRGLKTTIKQPDSNDEDVQTQRTSLATPPQTAMYPVLAPAPSMVGDGTSSCHYVPILPWSEFTTPQVVMQEHRDFVHDAPLDAPLFESDDDLAEFLLEDYEPLLFSDGFDASLEDEQEISRILAECGW